MTQDHVESSATPLIKINHDDKLDKYFVNLKLGMHKMSDIQDLYDFNMALFDNGDPEEFFLFVCNLKMTLAASGMLTMGAKIQYLCTLVHGKALHQFEQLSADAESTNHLTE